MSLYNIREATEKDIDAIAKVYNSNYKFLVNHLGVEFVDNLFIANEMAEMRTAQFISCVIVDIQTNDIVGVLDYKPDDTVYLSLLMIDSKQQKSGLGSKVYKEFEESIRKLGKKAVRIDVVNDYVENVMGFWEKQGYVAKNEIKLSWGSKQSTANVMVKVFT